LWVVWLYLDYMSHVFSKRIGNEGEPEHKGENFVRVITQQGKWIIIIEGRGDMPDIKREME